MADDIHFKFQRALKELGSHAQALPVYGMGHSLGSLLQLLIGSRYLVKLEGNILISYTNKPGEALAAHGSGLGDHSCAWAKDSARRRGMP